MKSVNLTTIQKKKILFEKLHLPDKRLFEYFIYSYSMCSIPLRRVSISDPSFYNLIFLG